MGYRVHRVSCSWGIVFFKSGSARATADVSDASGA